jgi:hypothetical protein
MVPPGSTLVSSPQSHVPSARCTQSSIAIAPGQSFRTSTVKLVGSPHSDPRSVATVVRQSSSSVQLGPPASRRPASVPELVHRLLPTGQHVAWPSAVQLQHEPAAQEALELHVAARWSQTRSVSRQ